MSQKGANMGDVKETSQVFYDEIFHHTDVIEALIEYYETEDLLQIFSKCYRVYFQNMHEKFVANHLATYENTCELPDFVLSKYSSILEETPSQRVSL